MMFGSYGVATGHVCFRYRGESTIGVHHSQPGMIAERLMKGWKSGRQSMRRALVFLDVFLFQSERFGRMEDEHLHADV